MQPPFATLMTGGERSVPHAVAVGPDGAVYVGRYAKGRQDPFTFYINVYAPGASGHAVPIRTLIAPNFDNLYIDSSGFLYLSVAGTVEIYSPDAQGSDLPVRTIQVTDQTLLGAMTMDSTGALYVAAPAIHTIYVYTNPVSNPQLARKLCPKRYPQFLATDDVGHLFTADGNAGLFNRGISAFAPGEDRCPARAQYRVVPRGYTVSHTFGIARRGGTSTRLCPCRSASRNTSLSSMLNERGSNRLGC